VYIYLLVQIDIAHWPYSLLKGVVGAAKMLKAVSNLIEYTDMSVKSKSTNLKKLF